MAQIRVGPLVGPLARVAVTDAQRPDGARENQAFDARGRSRVEHVAGAPDVDLVEVAGVAGPEPVEGRDVEHGPASGQGSADAGRVAQVAGPPLDAESLEVAGVGVRLHHRRDPVSGRDEGPGHGRTDEPVGAGHEDPVISSFHATSLARRLPWPKTVREPN